MHLRTSFEQSHRTYGSPRVWRDLHDWGHRLPPARSFASVRYFATSLLLTACSAAVLGIAELRINKSSGDACRLWLTVTFSV